MSASAPSHMPRFVTYLRVSTDKQGRSGLGLEAQRQAVLQHATAAGGRIIGEHVEVESGRKKDRSQLAAALVIAKLDRLARNVHFVASDMPTVNRLIVHILAAVAEEARMISARTKAALAAAKARGVTLGNPLLLARCLVLAARARDAQQAEARGWTEAVLPYLEQARAAGATTLWQLADALMKHGVLAGAKNAA